MTDGEFRDFGEFFVSYPMKQFSPKKNTSRQTKYGHTVNISERYVYNFFELSCWQKNNQTDNKLASFVWNTVCHTWMSKPMAQQEQGWEKQSNKEAN